MINLILWASVVLIVFAIIVPKPSQRHRAERIKYLLDQAAAEQVNSTSGCGNNPAH